MEAQKIQVTAYADDTPGDTYAAVALQDGNWTRDLTVSEAEALAEQLALSAEALRRQGY